ncbi:Helix-turn-helix [bacterium A37T11]|nr:Helix-turn-helix [bacterium A37T11]
MHIYHQETIKMEEQPIIESNQPPEIPLFMDLADHILGQLPRRLKETRELLGLSIQSVARVTHLDEEHIGSLENQASAPSLATLIPLLAFYGFSLTEFFNFSKALPSSQALKTKMMRFHEKYGTEAYKVVYNRPKLINFIESTLLETSLFDHWITDKEVYEYCKENYNYRFLRKSIPNTLDLAVEKGFLIRDPDASPKRYKKVK